MAFPSPRFQNPPRSILPRGSIGLSFGLQPFGPLSLPISFCSSAPKLRGLRSRRKESKSQNSLYPRPTKRPAYLHLPSRDPNKNSAKVAKSPLLHQWPCWLGERRTGLSCEREKSKKTRNSKLRDSRAAKPDSRRNRGKVLRKSSPYSLLSPSPSL